MTGYMDTSLEGDRGLVKTGWFEHGTSRIYYEEAGTGDPLLLLPGGFGSIEEFSALRVVLVSEGYRVITADLPGSGRSLPQPRAYTASYYEDDARSFTALLQHLGVGQTHLMGFSDGGEVSLLIAATTTGIARSVVTWGASGTLSDPEGQMREVLYNIIDHPIPSFQPFSQHLIATYGEANARAMTQNLVAAFNDIIAAGGDIILSKANSIVCPVLLITGAHDFLASPALVSELAARIPSADMLTVEDAEHEPLHQTRTEWLAQILFDWLKQH
ncbi:MAG: alpha/beta hydrolase [Chloroflexota bacterium]